MASSPTIVIEPNEASRQPGLPRRIGLVAGWGRYPVVIAQTLVAQGCEVYCVGITGHADPELATLCHGFRWNGFGRLGAAMRFFRRHGVTEATMAGKVFKQFILNRWLIVRHLPDLATMRAFAPHFLTFRKDNRDDTLLSAIVELFAGRGIHFGPATDYAPSLLVKEGQLSRRGPTPGELKDIAFGWKIAKEMGRLDVGQSVVVCRQAVVAVEAIEGTDQCIRRAGPLCPSGGFTVVKVAKPRQDMRFDVPTVGVGTLESMVAAGGKVLAIEADRTIVIDQPEVVDYANRHKIVLLAIKAPAP